MSITYCCDICGTPWKQHKTDCSISICPDPKVNDIANAFKVGYDHGSEQMQALTKEKILCLLEINAKLRGLLSQSAYHLKQHAAEYQHPGQYDLIELIEETLEEAMAR